MGRDFVTMEAIDRVFSQIIDSVRTKLFPAATKTQIFEAFNST
jgi:hypothetical protein